MKPKCSLCHRKLMDPNDIVATERKPANLAIFSKDDFKTDISLTRQSLAPSLPIQFKCRHCGWVITESVETAKTLIRKIIEG